MCVYLSIYSNYPSIYLQLTHNAFYLLFAIFQINTGKAELFWEHIMLHLGQMFYKKSPSLIYLKILLHFADFAVNPKHISALESLTLYALNAV